jgi:hypothetical protein
MSTYDERLGGRIQLPTTEQGWKDRYNWLWDWYSGRDYTPRDITELKLFHAVDNSLNLTAVTRRVCRDAAFVVDTDSRVLAAGRWSLEPAAGRAGMTSALDIGAAVWARSQLQEQKYGWIHRAATVGDYYVEAVRERDKSVKLYGYDPRWCEVTYADDGITIERLVVHQTAFEDAGLTMITTRRRTITPQSVTVEDLRDDGFRPMGSYAHGLGVAPVVHVKFGSVANFPEHGLWAAFGMDPIMQEMDSAIAQMRAIFQRYAHPHVVVKGARNTDDQLEAFGRIIDGLPVDGDIKYLEPTLAGLQPMLEALRWQHERVREQTPEFVFGAGANTSGRAYEMRLDAFKRKMREVQTRTLAAFARVTAYAYHMADGSAYDPADELYRIKAPPILPMDEAGTIARVIQLRGAGLLRRVDAVAVLQAANLLDEEIDPAAYVAGLVADGAAEPEAVTPDPQPLTPPASTDTLVSGDSDDV